MIKINVFNNGKITCLLPYIYLLILTIPLLFINGDQQSLMAHDEGLYATRAKLMFNTGNWINPWDEGHHKTPGIYWIIAISYNIFGINEIAVRLPTILFSLGCSFLIYEITKIIINKRVALLSAIILNLQFLWLRYSRIGNPDHGTIFLILLGIFCLLKAEGIENNCQTKKYLIFSVGICFGLSFLIRSFMIFVPMMALLPYLIIEHKRHKHLINIWLYLGFLLGLMPTILWLIADVFLYQNNTAESLINLIFDFGTNQRDNNNLFFYFWNIFVLSFPWIIFTIIGSIYYYKKFQYKYKWLILGTPLIILGELTLFSTRLSHYSLIIYPFLAILAGLGIDLLINKKNSESKFSSKLLSIISYSLGFLAGLILLASIGIILNSQFNIISLDGDISKYSTIGLTLGIPWILLPFLHRNKNQLKLWLIVLILGNWLTFINLGKIGLLTDINPDIKTFVTRPEISQILNNNPVYIAGSGKTKVLLKFYTSDLKRDIEQTKNLEPNLYVWIKNSELSNLKLAYYSYGDVKDWQLIKTK